MSNDLVECETEEEDGEKEIEMEELDQHNWAEGRVVVMEDQMTTKTWRLIGTNR